MQSVAEQSILQERERETMLAAVDSGAEVAIYELIDKQPSGMIRIGTEKLEEPDELNVPGFRQILTQSAYYKPSKKKGEGNERVVIRYRASSNFIDPATQEEKNHEANAENDRIVFKNGRLIVVNEGATAGLFAFLRKDSRNATNPLRIPSASEVYREVFPEKENEEDNDNVFAEANAMKFIEGLITDKTAGKMKYNEYRLNALAQFFRIVTETPAGKIKALIATAKMDANKFLKGAQQFEQQSASDIINAEKLGILAFQATRVILLPKNKVLITFTDKLTKEDQVMQLAGYLQSPEGNNDSIEFRTELNIAREKSINS